jgi:hypothetical protein
MSDPEDHWDVFCDLWDALDAERILLAHIPPGRRWMFDQLLECMRKIDAGFGAAGDGWRAALDEIDDMDEMDEFAEELAERITGDARYTGTALETWARLILAPSKPAPAAAQVRGARSPEPSTRRRA